MSELQDLSVRIRRFTEERDWEQFHAPKNLAMGLSVEAAEVLEHFLWLTEAESRDLEPARRDAVADELGDVLIYLVNLSDHLGIDLIETAGRKLEKNAAKYPADVVRGKAHKYTAYRGQGTERAGD